MRHTDVSHLTKCTTDGCDRSKVECQPLSSRTHMTMKIKNQISQFDEYGRFNFMRIDWIYGQPQWTECISIKLQCKNQSSLETLDKKIWLFMATKIFNARNVNDKFPLANCRSTHTRNSILFIEFIELILRSPFIPASHTELFALKKILVYKISYVIFLILIEPKNDDFR